MKEHKIIPILDHKFKCCWDMKRIANLYSNGGPHPVQVKNLFNREQNDS